MSTQVILLERVHNLGELGEIVAVKPGYARNYLLPQKKALRASKANVAYFEAQKKQIEAQNAEGRKQAEKDAKTLEGLTVAIIRQSSEAGQLYGSVTARDISDAINGVGKISVERSAITLNQNFKFLGLFPVAVSLHPEVSVEITINIARSAEEAVIQLETGRAVTEEAPVVVEEAPEALIDEENLSAALEEDALEAEKVKAAEDAEAQAEADEKAAKKSAEKAEKAAKKAAAEAEAAGEEDGAEEAAEETPAEEEEQA